MATLSVSSALPNFEAASFVEAEWTKQEVFTGVRGLLVGKMVAEYMWLVATTRCTNSLQLPILILGSMYTNDNLVKSPLQI